MGEERGVSCDTIPERMGGLGGALHSRHFIISYLTLGTLGVAKMRLPKIFASVTIKVENNLSFIYFKGPQHNFLGTLSADTLCQCPRKKRV